MRFRFALFLLALFVLAPLGSQAWACASFVDYGPGVTYEQYREAQERQERIDLRNRARANLAAGIDAAGALAEMLVPNVRPVRIDITSCGSSEYDGAPGMESPDDWLVGTRYEPRQDEFESVVDDFEGVLPGEACNLEFRTRFAGDLRRRLRPRQLRAAYLFLGARWTSLVPEATVRRFMAFSYGQRRPPVVWAVWGARQSEEVVEWTRRNNNGRAVQRAVDAFWQQNAHLLDSMATTCPVTAAAWEADRARFLTLVEAEDVRRQASEEARRQAARAADRQ